MAVVDNAVYVHGRRYAEPASLEVTYEMLRDQQGMGWIGLYRPDASEVRSVATEFEIHDLAVEDTISAHQRPKLERYDDVLFTVLRPARYIEADERVEFGDPTVSRRIYELSREVIEFQRATKPLLKIVTDLTSGFEKYHVNEELQRFLRDVHDHTIRIVERVDGFRVLLQNILTVNATLVGQRQNEETQRLTETSVQQNEEVKKISSWAAILFAPTLVGTIYGMNFTHMPELDWRYGYPMAIALMLLMGCLLYLVFKRRGWL